MNNSPHDATIGAAVNAAARIVLYDENGKGIEVAEADAAYWLSKGFTRSPADPEEAHNEFNQALAAVNRAVEDYIRGCLEDGLIDPGDRAARFTALVAFGLMEAAWSKLDRALLGKFPKLEPEPEEMINLEDKTVRVDPGQVELLLEQGWRLP